MTIKTSYSILSGWAAIDEDTYDGAEDSSTRHQIGLGNTEEEAIADLKLRE
jgi:hypothetical protein